MLQLLLLAMYAANPSRVGASVASASNLRDQSRPQLNLCFFSSRHLLLSGGPVFTEDLWLIVSEGLREAVHTTLSNLRDLVACFQPGSYSVNGDEGMTVRVVARRDVITADMIRLQQVAEQVG